MPYQPTTAELRDAFRRGRLWWLGWTFQKAMSVPCVAKCLANQVRAERVRREQQQGKPAPVQPALFYGKTRMSEPTFTITLDDLKALVDAAVEVDGLRPRGDMRIGEKVYAAHAAAIRTLGPDVGLIYDTSEVSEPRAA